MVTDFCRTRPLSADAHTRHDSVRIIMSRRSIELKWPIVIEYSLQPSVGLFYVRLSSEVWQNG